MEILHSLLTNLWAVFLVVFFFGGSIFVHELGHFLAARRRGAHVERFSIGMGPILFRKKGKDGVEYCISWLPIGGYVKLPQLADLRGLEGESAADAAKLPELPYTTKLVVFLAGAIFNVIFAFLLATVLWMIGSPTDDYSATTRIGFVRPTVEMTDHPNMVSPAAKAGLQSGDNILAIDGTKVNDWTAVREALALGSRRTANGQERLVQLTIDRHGQILTISVNPVLAGDEKTRQIGVYQSVDIALAAVPSDSLAAKIGLRAGDRITRADTTDLFSTVQLEYYLKDHAAKPVVLTVERGSAAAFVTVPPHTTAQELLRGVEAPSTVHLIHENPIQQLTTILDTTVKSLVSLINPHSDVRISNMSGPIGIVRGFWDAATSEFPVRVAIWFTILINISLAVFNLLPIPVLDGGHILFATIGKLRGRALPPDFIAAAQSVFVVLLFSMVLYISYFDVRRIVRSDRAEEPAPAASTPAANH